MIRSLFTEATCIRIGNADSKLQARNLISRIEGEALRAKILALSFLLVAAVTCSAASISFPDDFIPFTSIYYTAYVNGNVLIVGEGTGEPFRDYLQSLPIPNSGQKYIDARIELAPGRFFSHILVPTEAERQGDFSAFGIPVYDPYTGRPFPGNHIPFDRLGGIFAFRSNFTPVTPTPEPATGCLIAAGIAGLAVIRKRFLPRE